MNTTTTNQQASNHADTHDQADANPRAETGFRTRPQPLCRSVHDRMLGGVAGGLADYFGVDATLVRIVIAVLAVVGGAGVPLYLAGWLLIPEEGCDQSIVSSFIQSRQAARYDR